MDGFGQRAGQLAQEVHAQEQMLELLKEFRDNGGAYRLVIQSDQQDEKLNAALATASKHLGLRTNLVGALIGVAQHNLEKAKLELRSYTNAN